MPLPPVPAAYFGAVLGLSGMGQAWRVAHRLWGVPPWISEAVLAVATLVWASLLLAYLVRALRDRAGVLAEMHHPVQGGTPALLAVSTLLIALAAVPYSTPGAWVLATLGLAWNLGYSLWHTGQLWQGGRQPQDTVPTLYLPTVAGNFTSAAALGALGHADWGWLFLGMGVFSWLSLEPLFVQRFWQTPGLPAPQRATLGIQFAPAVVCAMAWLLLAPGTTDHWVLMLWGYGLFQLALGLRLGAWLGAQPYSAAYWAYTFGISAATVTTLKLALSGVGAAQVLAVPVFVGANLFIGVLALRSGARVLRTLSTP